MWRLANLPQTQVLAVLLHLHPTSKLLGLSTYTTSGHERKLNNPNCPGYEDSGVYNSPLTNAHKLQIYKDKQNPSIRSW